MFIKPSYIIMLAIAGSAYWSACAPGSRGYRQPELNLPASFDSSRQADTNSIAAIPWKTFFPDTALQQLISKGITHNFDLQLAVARVEESRQQLQQAKANYLPVLNIQGTGQYNRPSDNSLNGLSIGNFLGQRHLEDYNLAVGLSWEADIWGKIKLQKQAALATYLQTGEAARAVQTRLIVSIAEGYYNLLMLEEQLAIARKNLALADTIFRITRLQRDAGEVTTLAVQQATVQQQTTALLLPQLEQQKAIQQNALKLLTGELPGALTHAFSFNESPVLNTAINTGIPAAVVQLRPDVRAAELALKAANSRVGVAQASFYPSFIITASGGLNAFKASNWFEIPGSLFGVVGGAITQPLLQKRQLKTQLEIAKVNRQQSEISFKQSVYTAMSDVADAFVRVNKLQEQQVLTQAKTDTLQHAIFNAQLLFRSGMANYLEVITAQSNVLQSELALADIKRQQLSAIAQLYRALGGGVN
ncbi:efflux transporter outer membrane subunit [Filimonas effusa]|uniref:Efflux transporter outer membrane subunit n=1 Tax=Filimonas effusa TaxID=2508721 RepID=A0A4Q1D8Y8_9BACT|nr:efflux transporter outer membrane subunit [Filimonas effusa]RXK85827.1 efflux transporter outer membrane subunit [Filimonas effusa]